MANSPDSAWTLSPKPPSLVRYLRCFMGGKQRQPCMFPFALANSMTSLSQSFTSTVVSSEYIWLLDDLTPARPPQNPLKKLEIMIPPPPGTGSVPQTPTENPRKSRLLSGGSAYSHRSIDGTRRLSLSNLEYTPVGVQAMFQGGTARGTQSNVRDHDTEERDGSECLSMMHSAAYRDHLFFVYQKHIVIVDICIQQVGLPRQFLHTI